MAPLRVLQVASFIGNVGDNANHFGFRRWFEVLIGQQVVWNEFEIRRVFRREAAFDGRFVDLANSHDLLIVGGGNFFEFWVEGSPTGTSFSITPELFSAISCPVFFNSLGVDAGQGHTAATRAAFCAFLGSVLENQRNFVSVRNDGSFGTLKRHFPELPLAQVHRLPDGGFFAPYVRAATAASAPTMGINIAGDMLERRFAGGERLDAAGFTMELASFIAETATRYPALRFVFFPHIYSDLGVVAGLLGQLPDHVRRGKVRVEAYDTGDRAARGIFEGYLACSVVLAMRFHATVVPFAHNIPTIGLACYPQIEFLYRELGMEARCVDVSAPQFSARLSMLVDDLSVHGDTWRLEQSAVNARLEVGRRAVAEALMSWLRGCRIE